MWKEGPRPESGCVRPYRAMLVLLVLGLMTIAIYSLVSVASACGPGAACTKI